MTGLDGWLKQATRHLSRDSAAHVRTEIQEHYESALEVARSGGASAEEADRQTVTALGDAKDANCKYRNVLLTSAEARMLREGNWEARAVCSRPWLRWGALLVAAGLSLAGAITAIWALLVGGIAMGVIFAAPFLPVYTRSRGRVFRCVKWTVLLGTLGLAFGPEVLKWSWLLFSCLWPMVWIESTRISIRRKLPIAEWPKQLYL